MLCRKCDTRDPFTIAAKLGIRVLHEPLGSIRGYYSRTHRIKFIHINQDLSKERTAASMRARIRTCNLTPEKQYTILRANTLYSVNKLETEANRFMALLLHPATEIQDYAQCGYTLYQIADICGLTPELVEYIITTYNRNDAASS
mgnify:CR=1 FL=1